jgi:uncharacterized protein (TIRG00374 family)
MTEDRSIDLAPPPPRRSLARRLLRPARLVQVFVALVVLRWLAIPRLNDTGEVLGLLDEVPGGLLAVGAALGIGALVAYAQVTRSLLQRARRPRLHRAFGVVVTSVGVNRLVPFGAAAGTAVMFRLLTKEGPSPADVGVALSVQAIGSAIVLQLLLWPSLLLVSPGHLPTAVLVAACAAGAVILGLLVTLVWALVVRPSATIDVGARLVGRSRGPEGWVRSALGGLAASFATLVVRPRLLSAAAGWSVLNWLLDAASLWVFLWAFGAQVPPAWVLVAFGLANVAATVPILPGGFGVVETTLALVLTSLGADATSTLLGIAAYRLVHLWLPVPGALVSYSLLRLTRRRAPSGSGPGDGLQVTPAGATR